MVDDVMYLFWCFSVSVSDLGFLIFSSGQSFNFDVSLKITTYSITVIVKHKPLKKKTKHVLFCIAPPTIFFFFPMKTIKNKYSTKKYLEAKY